MPPVCDTDDCEQTLVLLPGKLGNGQGQTSAVYVCPACDVPAKGEGKSIIDISRENYDRSDS